MKHTDRNTFNIVQEIFFKNQPISLDVYCKESEHTKRAADIINFRKFIEKEGFQYDIATRANWDYRYKRFKDEEKEMFKKKEPSSFLDKSKEFLKKCYDAGEIIEYNDGQEWKDLPSGLPLDFSQFKEGTIRLKFNGPTYEQIMQFKQRYGEPIMLTNGIEHEPLLAFCFSKGFCHVVPSDKFNKLQWDTIAIWRYYGKKEYLPETPISELQSILKEKSEKNLDQELLDCITRNKMLDYVMKDMKDLTDQTTIRAFMDVMNYIRWEFNNIESKFKNISNTDDTAGENK